MGFSFIIRRSAEKCQACLNKSLRLFFTFLMEFLLRLISILRPRVLLVVGYSLKLYPRKSNPSLTLVMKVLSGCRSRPRSLRNFSTAGLILYVSNQGVAPVITKSSAYRTVVTFGAHFLSLQWSLTASKTHYS